MATQATPDEYRRIDKWRCNVADECVAQLHKLNINNNERKSSVARKSSPSVKDDSLVIYKPQSHEEVFDDFNSSGKPVTIIRRYKSQKGSPPARKSAPHVVQVTEDPSSSSSNGSRHARTERPSTAYRSMDRKIRRRDEDRSERSFRTRRDHDASYNDRGGTHRRRKSEVATVVVPNKRSSISTATLARNSTLRRMLKLSNKDVKPRQREDSAHSVSKTTKTRSRSIDGRDSNSTQHRRSSRQEDASLRSYNTRDAYIGGGRTYYDTSASSAPRYYDLRDARRQQRPSSSYMDGDYDRPPRRNKSLNHGSVSSNRHSAYENHNVYDDPRVDDEIDRIHRDVERYRRQAKEAPATRGSDVAAYGSRGDYGNRDDSGYGYSSYDYESPRRDRQRRHSVYDDYGGYGR